MEEEKDLEQPVEVTEKETTVAVPSTANRDKFFEGLRKKHPDIEDEEGLFGAAMEGYDAEHEFAKQQRGEVNRLASIMNENPDLAAMYAEMFERGPKGNPEMALINISDLLKDYINGNISDEEYSSRKAADAKEKEDKAAADAKCEEEKQVKLEAQMKVFEDVCKEEGLDFDETMNKIAETLLNPMAAYEIGKEQVKALINMVNYDEDVERARVQGRNEQIETRKRKLERQSDGIPTGGSAARLANSDKQTQLQMIGNRRAAANKL